MNATTLSELESLPPGVLELPATRLHERLAGPTLIHVPGVRTPPLFVGVLLHGDEASGWDAVRRLLRQAHGVLPRALSLFVGNVAAAREGRRRMPGQPDFQRIWQDGGLPEARIATAVVEAMRRRGVHAAIDVHDHNGPSPPFAVITGLEPPVLGLARAFGPLAVLNHPLRPLAARAFAELAPAVTVECGDIRDPHGAERAFHFVERRLSEPSMPHATLQALQLFVADVRVTVAPGHAFSFGPGKGLQLRDDLGPSSFRRLPAGTLFARQAEGPLGLVAHDADGADVTGAYFEHTGADVRLAREVFPAFWTTDPDLVRDDAVCYFMRPFRSPYQPDGAGRRGA